VDRALTDLLAASLSRSQLCLLAIWLAVGSERLSWRICGLIAGSCFVFIVFSRFVFPGIEDIGRNVFWLDEQWAYYFRLSGPGDVLIKAPILIGGVAAPLLIWRGWRAIWSVRQSGLPRVKPGSVLERGNSSRSDTDSPLSPGFAGERDRERGLLKQSLARWLRFQFRMQDIIVWIVTLSLALAAVYRTAPYPGWYGDLISRWREVSRLETPPDVYCAASAVVYVLVACVSLWAVYSKISLWFRVPIALMLVISPAFGFELWLRDVAENATSESLSSVWSDASAETVTAIVAATVMMGSLVLVRLYGMVSARRRRRTAVAFTQDFPRSSGKMTTKPEEDEGNEMATRTK
jgi:hypothetical protein